MQLRVIQAADVEAYRQLRQASEKEFPQFVGASVEQELSLHTEALAALLANYPENGNYVYGVFEKQNLLGVAAIIRKKSSKYSHKAFLWGMYIYPEYRRQGISNLLMDHAIAWCKATSGIIALQLFVTTSNTQAISLYQRYGFVTYGTEKNHMFSAGAYHDAHLFELDLSHQE